MKEATAKECELDPLPTWLVKRASDVLGPVIVRMCNATFSQTKLPSRSKLAVVRPLLKKRTLDPNAPASYRPISNLSFVSKVIEKVVDARLTDHVHKHHLHPVFQLSYRQFHSTETTIACILDMICAVDQGHVGALMLLNVSATFDTVNHQILIEVLQR